MPISAKRAAISGYTYWWDSDIFKSLPPKLRPHLGYLLKFKWDHGKIILPDFIHEAYRQRKVRTELLHELQRRGLVRVTITRVKMLGKLSRLLAWGRPTIRKRLPIPSSVRTDVLAEGKCAICGSVDQPSLDHIIPVSKGGSDDRNNLQRLCWPCNKKKGAKLLVG